MDSVPETCFRKPLLPILVRYTITKFFGNTPFSSGYPPVTLSSKNLFVPLDTHTVAPFLDSAASYTVDGKRQSFF